MTNSKMSTHIYIYIYIYTYLYVHTRTLKLACIAGSQNPHGARQVTRAEHALGKWKDAVKDEGASGASGASGRFFKIQFVWWVRGLIKRSFTWDDHQGSHKKQIRLSPHGKSCPWSFWGHDIDQPPSTNQPNKLGSTNQRGVSDSCPKWNLLDPKWGSTNQKTLTWFRFFSLPGSLGNWVGCIGSMSIHPLMIGIGRGVYP